MAEQTTMVRVYRNAEAYARDAAVLGSQGWRVVNVVEQQGRPGCTSILLLGIFSLGRRRTNLVATYTR